MAKTFDTPCLNFKKKLEDLNNTIEFAATDMMDTAMLYIADLEAQLAEQDELILGLKDEVIRLKHLKAAA